MSQQASSLPAFTLASDVSFRTPYRAVFNSQVRNPQVEIERRPSLLASSRCVIPHSALE
jgi:hypothetical protein